MLINRYDLTRGHFCNNEKTAAAIIYPKKFKTYPGPVLPSDPLGADIRGAQYWTLKNRGFIQIIVSSEFCLRHNIVWDRPWLHICILLIKYNNTLVHINQIVHGILMNKRWSANSWPGHAFNIVKKRGGGIHHINHIIIVVVVVVYTTTTTTISTTITTTITITITTTTPTITITTTTTTSTTTIITTTTTTTELLLISY